MNGLWYVLVVVLLLAVVLGVMLGGAELLHPQATAMVAAKAAAELQAQKDLAAIQAAALARRVEIALEREQREAQLKAELWGWPAKFLVVALGFGVLLVAVCVAYYVLCLADIARQNAVPANRPLARTFAHNLAPNEVGGNGHDGRRDEVVEFEKAA